MRTNTFGIGGRTRSIARVAGITATVLAASALLAAPAATAAQPAAKATIYNNIPSPLPGNAPSVGFEATSASEFGGEVSFAGTNRQKPQVTVLMSSWACQHGYWNTGNCATTKKAKFNQSLRLTVYAVGDDGAVGAQLGSVTHTFGMPYRPAANYSKCAGADAGKWYSKSDGTTTTEWRSRSGSSWEASACPTMRSSRLPSTRPISATTRSVKAPPVSRPTVDVRMTR